MLIVWYSGVKYMLAETFVGMPSLEMINLQDNLIEELNGMLFSTNKRVKTLNISGNKIKRLPDNLLVEMSALENFIANRNSIASLPPQLFLNNTKLEFVNLNNNNITTILLKFESLTTLKKVLGLQNPCANFFLNNVVTAKQLDDLVKTNCSKKAIPKPGQWKNWNQLKITEKSQLCLLSFFYCSKKGLKIFF